MNGEDERWFPKTGGKGTKGSMSPAEGKSALNQCEDATREEGRTMERE